MKFYDLNNNEVLDVIVDDSSYRLKEIMGDNKLFIDFALDYPLELPVFVWCEFLGEKYFLMRPQTINKLNNENHQYHLEMDTYQTYLKSQKFERFIVRRTGDYEEIDSDVDIEFSLIMTPEQYVQLIVDNMNQKDEERGWKVGQCVDAQESLLDFNDVYIWDALNIIAESFNTEWEVEGKTIHMRKVEKDRENAVPLRYGKGGGFLPGIRRTNEKNRIGVLRVKTSDRNIDLGTYGSKTLKMPKNYTINYENTNYVTDKSGSRIQREIPVISSPILPESTLDLTNIYPSRVGEVTEVIAVDAENDLYDIIDTTIPDDLNYNDCRIDGEEAVIIFQTGQLAGIEIPISQGENDVFGYDHDQRRFELVPVTTNGVTYPSGFIVPQVGDKYAVFNIKLPKRYIDEAEQKLLEEAVKYFYENENPKFTYNATLSQIYAKQKWNEIGGYLNIGYFVKFSDPQYLAEPVDIRITAVKNYVNRPYSPEITLSNSVKGKSFNTKIRELPNTEQTINRKTNENKQYFKRNWQQAKELMNSWQHDILDMSEGINPVYIQTMQILVGHETSQYRFVNSRSNPVELDHDFRYDHDTEVFTCDAGLIQHMTIGIDSLSPEHKPKEYKFWNVSSFISPSLQGQGNLWLYIRTDDREGSPTSGGHFYFREDMIRYDDEAGVYNFVVGHISSVFQDERSFVTLYGFTEILPGQVRVNKIVNPDGTNFWDMLAKTFMIGDDNSYLSYNYHSPNQLRLKGTIVQSPSGETDYLEVDRGSWQYGNVYYPGDKVNYNGNVYKCINTSSPGIYPTNTYYWKLLVTKGDDGHPGNEGQSYLYAYYPSNSINPPSRPSRGGEIPSGWYSEPTKNGMRYVYISQCVKSNGTWSSWSYPTQFIIEPEPGDPGPGIVYRGEWSQLRGSRFYNNAVRQDVIHTDWGIYYRYVGKDNTIVSSFVDEQWRDFGAQFNSVATDILFTPNGNVGGWIFKNERMESQSGGAYLNGKTGEVNITGTFTTGKGANRLELSGEKLSAINNDKEVAAASFTNGSGTFTARYYNGSDFRIRALLSGVGYQLFDSSNNALAFLTANYNDGSINFYLNPSKMPTSRNSVPVGYVYLDGETLKIRRN